MAEKPSLYVVEKKEVVILVVIFILVTVLAFTLGVKYGESVGRNTAISTHEAQKEHADAAAEKIGGTLGAEHGESENHGEAPAEEHGAPHGEAHAVAADANGAEHAASPEAQATTAHKAEPAHNSEGAKEPKLTNETVAAVETNSDKYLLEALKEAGVETPIANKMDKTLPEEVKKVSKGDYLIQVGSYPTKRDAEQQVNALKQKKVTATILPPFKDRQGEWYRVVIGSYKTRVSAEKEAKSLKAKGHIRSYFVKKQD